MSKYSPELKAQIIKEVGETKNIVAVAKAHNLNHKTVWSWVNRKRIEPEMASYKKVTELQRKLSALTLENQILKDLLKKTNQAWLSECK